MTKKKEGSSHHNGIKPDYRYRLQHFIPERDPKNQHRFLRDANGNVKMKVKYGPWENGYLNRNIDCYDAYIEDHYVGTVHVKTGSEMGVVKKRFLEINKNFPHGRLDEVEFMLTCQFGKE